MSRILDRILGAAFSFVVGAGLCAECPAGERPAGVSDARLMAPDAEPRNWLTAGRDYGDNRFSPLHSIHEGNVAHLQLAWYYDLDTHRGQEATPVEADGVLYTSTAWSKVLALRAATGEPLWSYDPKVDGSVARHACCDMVNRGVALYQGRVYVATLDGRLIALDARTGEPAWSVLTVDRKRPYTITGAPLAAAGKILIGNAGGEYGVRGYVTAYDARSGKKLWRFYTVPGNPARGFENAALRRAAKTWSGAWWKDGGGGTVWNSLSYDPDLGLVYFGTGNASPWAEPGKDSGRGDGLYCASIMAVHLADGAYAWHYQTTPGDSWDFDSDETLTLATLKIGGRDRKVVMQAAKNGFFYVLDRASGELLSARNFVPVSWAKGVDLKTGRPDIDPEARYAVTGKMYVGTPGPLGAHSWQPTSFSPRTGLVYIPAQELSTAYLKDKDFRPEPAGHNTGLDFATTSLPQDEKIKAAVLASLKGFLSAWDPVAGREVWRAEHAGPWNGGVLATGGNLVFQGTASGELNAYRASDGAKLWSYPAQTGIIAAPMTYMVDGRQFVTVLAGWGGIYPMFLGELSYKAGRLPNRSRVLTFALDGAASLPPAAVTTAELPPPPTATAPAAVIAEGAKHYARYCAMCHGDAAYSGGLVPDLRYSHALADDALWHVVVEQGALSAQGMSGFGSTVGPKRLTAVRAFLISRAQQSYAALHAADARSK